MLKDNLNKLPDEFNNSATAEIMYDLTESWLYDKYPALCKWTTIVAAVTADKIAYRGEFSFMYCGGKRMRYRAVSSTFDSLLAKVDKYLRRFPAQLAEW